MIHNKMTFKQDILLPCHQWQRDGVYLARTAFWHRRTRPRAATLLLLVIQVERERAGLGRVTGEKAHTRLSR